MDYGVLVLELEYYAAYIRAYLFQISKFEDILDGFFEKRWDFIRLHLPLLLHAKN